MNVLNGILSESNGYYISIKEKIGKKLADLPKGSIKERSIAGQRYYYIQQRVGEKVIHKYLGKKKPEELIKKIQMRKSLKNELKKVNESLKMLDRVKGKSHA